MTDLRDLVDPLLSDPPHAAPPLDELQARVDRRRRRRARAIGVASVIAVVLVAAAVLALPRDTELRVGDDAPTTQPPPPFTPGPVELIVSPRSAPLSASRTVEIRNDGTVPFDAACHQYALVRWDGSTWVPTATVMFNDAGTWFTPPSAIVDSQCVAPDLIQPGDSQTIAFTPQRPTWFLMTDGSTPPADADPLPEGWYELREPPHAVAGGPTSLGRFEVTDETATDVLPPLDLAPVQLAVSPESAPLDTVRNLEIRNTADVAYTDCSLRFDLLRWDGTTWVPEAILAADTDPPYLDEVERAPTDGQCQNLSTVPAGSSTTVPLELAALPRYQHGGTIPASREPLAPGRYELRNSASASEHGSPAAVGRFEITDGTPSAPPSPGPETTSTTAGGDEAPVTVDLYPLELGPAREVLPTAAFAVDQDTIALAWTGHCNEPADHVSFAAHDGEVELRLSVGQHVVIDCLGESDDWMVTFDVPFDVPFAVTDRVRLVARAQGVEGETEVHPGIVIGSTNSSSRLPDGSPVSFRAVESVDPTRSGLRFVEFLPPIPLAESFACDLSAVETDGVFIPELQVQELAAAGGLLPCASGSFGLPVSPGVTLLGQP